MVYSYFVDVTIKYFNRQVEMSLPRFTKIENFLEMVFLRPFWIEGEIAIYSKDWFRFLDLDKTLDEQYVLSGCTLEIIRLDNK